MYIPFKMLMTENRKAFQFSELLALTRCCSIQSTKAFSCPIVYMYKNRRHNRLSRTKKTKKSRVARRRLGHIGHVSRGAGVAQAADVKLLLVLQPTTVSNNGIINGPYGFMRLDSVKGMYPKQL